MPDVTLRVDHLVSLIRRQSPQTLHELTDRYPASAEVLAPGQTLGDGASTDLAVELALNALDDYAPQANLVLNVLRRRLTVLRYVDLISRLASAVGGGTALAVLVASVPHAGDKAIYSAAVSLVGTVTSIFVTWMAGSATGSGSLVGDFNSIAEKLVMAQSLQREIRLLSKGVDQPKLLKKALQQAEALARDLNLLVLRYRSSPS